ncbi:MAG: hypothetical protein IKR18_00355 [Bacteroidaceae bacterium]|nr:hypothetical protein [Bacteroidaceae bacterium]
MRILSYGDPSILIGGTSKFTFMAGKHKCNDCEYDDCWDCWDECGDCEEVDCGYFEICIGYSGPGCGYVDWECTEDCKGDNDEY